MGKTKKTTTVRKATGPRPANDSGLNKAEAKKALDAATKAIKSLKKQADKNFWQIGRKLNAVAELELYSAAGVATIADYAEGVLDISKATAYAYMRVAAAFGEEIATTFGAAKLDRGLAYIAATPEDETARDLPKLKVRVPGADGKIEEKPFAETSTRELSAAAAHEKAAQPAKRRKTSATITRRSRGAWRARTRRSIAPSRNRTQRAPTSRCERATARSSWTFAASRSASSRRRSPR